MRIMFNLSAIVVSIILGSLCWLTKDTIGIMLLLVQTIAHFMLMTECKKNYLLSCLSILFFVYMAGTGFVLINKGSFSPFDLLPFGLALMFIFLTIKGLFAKGK